MATDIRTAIALYKKKWKVEPEHMSVISHSFGTYIVCQILLKYPDIHWNRVIFCGSVVKDDFKFQNTLAQFEAPLLNEIGTKDYWPAIAESAGWGFGAVGSYSFNRPGVRTRWHHGLSHGDFLNEKFCQKFWVPFLQGLEGDTPKNADASVNCPILIRLIAAIPLRIIPIAVMILAAWFIIKKLI